MHLKSSYYTNDFKVRSQLISARGVGGVATFSSFNLCLQSGKLCTPICKLGQKYTMGLSRLIFHRRIRIRVETKLKSWASFRKSHAHSRPWENSEKITKSYYSHDFDRFQCLLGRETDSTGLFNPKKFMLRFRAASMPIFGHKTEYCYVYWDEKSIAQVYSVIQRFCYDSGLCPCLYMGKKLNTI